MNEQGIKWAEGLYKLQERFSEIAEEIFKENKEIISDALHYLWDYLDEGCVTNEALRYGVRQEALRNLGVMLEYNATIYADQLRDIRGSTPTVKREET